MIRRLLVSAPLIAALAVPFAPAPGAGATTVHSTCVALGTYVMRHRGPLPLAATRPATIVFPGPFGSGTLRLTAYTGCGGGAATHGTFTLAHMYGPPITPARPSAHARHVAMPVPLGGLQAISGTISQNQNGANRADAASVLVAGMLTVGSPSPCAGVCPAAAHDVAMIRRPFGPVPGHLLWEAQAPTRIKLTFTVGVRIAARTVAYAVTFVGVKQK